MTPEDAHREKLLILRSTSLFDCLKEDNLVVLAKASRIVKIKKGEYLFYQDEPSHSLFILVSGKIAILLSSNDGREVILNELDPGTFLGEVSILAKTVRTATVQAWEDSKLLEIAAGPFLAILDVDHGLTRRMLELAAQRLVTAHFRENALAFLGARARIARVMLEMDKVDRLGPDKGYITLSQEELAQRTGLARQTVARELGNWRRRGWLLTGRGQIMLLNRAALQSMCD